MITFRAIDGSEIHVPQGINFECTGCGNCCFGWPVPVTAQDVKKIESLKTELGHNNSSFRPLWTSGEKLSVFTYMLDKREDGKCQFLMLDNRCQLHQNFGADAKPAMCRLFPFTFTETPTGVYVSASFAATGVLYNSGHALAEQKERIEEMLALFRGLFPTLKPDWSTLQLIDGRQLSWAEYLDIEDELFSLLKLDSDATAEVALMQAVKAVAQRAPADVNLDELAKMEARPKVVDQLLLKCFLAAYFPADEYSKNKCQPDADAVARSLISPPDKVEFSAGQTSFTTGDLTASTLGRLDDQSEALLLRFAYCRVFGKLFFGPGFQKLSLLAGLCHLTLLVSMVRIVLKARQKKERRETGFLETAELVRVLERRLTVADFSAKTRAITEVLMVSPERLERIIWLAK